MQLVSDPDLTLVNDPDLTSVLGVPPPLSACLRDYKVL